MTRSTALLRNASIALAALVVSAVASYIVAANTLKELNTLDMDFDSDN